MQNQEPAEIRLTKYSHGAGCGCKISPMVLDEILKNNISFRGEKKLLVGNHSRDDAAVYDLENGNALISTTDFFMPIVDDPFSFGRIAACNAISDVYAMGGRPLLAIAILGWPVNKLPPEIANRVIEGGRFTCQEAGIPLAGGHSIDSPEPIFGLAVNGLVAIDHIKQNDTAKDGDLLYLTKPLGVGILTTAEKKGILDESHRGLAANQMMQLNRIGEKLGPLPFVHAITDITGFGLLGHLLEMASGSGLSGILDKERIPVISKDLKSYIGQNAVPGGSTRNWDSYGSRIDFEFEEGQPYYQTILSDPQTSGGLLVAVDPSKREIFKSLLSDNGLGDYNQPIGFLTKSGAHSIIIR